MNTTEVIRELTNEIDELNFKLEQQNMNSIKLSSLIFKMKAGDLSIDEAYKELEDNMDKTIFESMYHRYITKDNLGPTFALESELKFETNFCEDDSDTTLNIKD